MSVYMGLAGSRHQGDFWGKIGKGIRRLGKNISKGIKVVAPLASVFVPAIGAATLAGRAISAAGKIKKAGRDARAVVQALQPSPMHMMTQMMTPTGAAPNRYSQTIGVINEHTTPEQRAAILQTQERRRTAYKRRLSTTAAARRSRAIRRAAARRRTARKRTTTRRRRTRRTTRRRY